MEQRYVILALECLVLFVADWLFNAFATSDAEISDLVGVSRSVGYVLLALPMVTCVLGFPLGPGLRSMYGMRVAILVAVALLCAGAFIDTIGAAMLSFTALCFGQVLLGAGFIIMFGMVVQVTLEWFEPSHRVLATTLGTVASEVGEAAAYFVSPYLSDTHAHFTLYTLLLLAMALGTLALLHRYLVDAPTTSSTGLTHRSIMSQYTELLEDRAFVRLLVVGAFEFGVLAALASLVEEILLPQHDSYDNIGIAAGLSVFGNLAAAPFLILYGLHRVNYKRALMTLFPLHMALLVVYAVVADNPSASWASIYALFIVRGFFKGAEQVLLFEFIAEMGHPNLPITSVSLLTVSFYLLSSSLILVVAFSGLEGSSVVWLGFGLYLVPTTLLLSVPNATKRQLAGVADQTPAGKFFPLAEIRSPSLSFK